MEKGTRVKMSEHLKTNLINNDCKDHVDEFGECIGVVIGQIYDWPEVDVRWQPSNLKYAYLPDDLTEVLD